MLFNSIHFFLFFIIVTPLYFLLPQRFRWMLLLSASCYFYMAFIPVYILILGFTIIIDYFAGILLENTKGRKRKYWLIASLFANIGVLAIFKYYNFLNNNISDLLNTLGYQNSIPNLSIILPIGLSFHTFQAMSYTIEVYRERQKAERHFGIYALYVMFYPQLVAGPIERPQNLLHQFYEKHKFEYNRIVDGLKMMLWGLFMKLVIADRLAMYVNAVYNNSANHSGMSLMLATAFFAIQIYCDFAGYSNIAIGAAKVMGFNLMTNFNRPYLAQSISEYWQRWHISLSTWFKDYLYISLGGNRVIPVRMYFNLFIVFVISGLWHGANWTYLLWGAIHGFYMMFAKFTAKWRKSLSTLIGLDRIPKFNQFIQISTTFALVCFAFIFFRADSIHEAMQIIQKIMSMSSPLFLDWSSSVVAYSLFGIFLLFGIEIKKEYYKDSFLLLNNQHAIIRYSTYTFLFLSILLLGVFDGAQFIYFQF